ncbi:MAG: glycosyltransferase family 4 protein [Methylococcaceae bacterium]|nr:glycosyltransferase family 4 protein [Methylococcaceae bacterium]
MNVLVLTQYFWPENFRINAIVQTLVEKGIGIEVLTGKPNYPEGSIYPGYQMWGCQYESKFGAAIHRIPLLARGKSAWRLGLNYLCFITSGLLFAPWQLRKKHFDVIFVYAPSPILQAIPALFLGWLKKAPVIIWVQDLWPESLSATGYVHNSWLLGCVRQTVRFIYRHTDLLLVQSRGFKEPVSSLASGTPVIYYPNSVDDTFTATSTTRFIPDLAGLDGKFVVMFTGNIGIAQAVEVIVEAADFLKEYAEIHFVILGIGSRWQWMNQEVQKRELTNVHLLGRFAVETMPGFMQRASALLVTLSNQEIFAATVPSKIQAYMAAGRPILACLNGEGARLVTEAEAGLSIPAENVKALADAILHLYGMMPEQREKFGSNGRRYYQEHFDHNRLVDQLIGHFLTTLDHRNKPQ